MAHVYLSIAFVTVLIMSQGVTAKRALTRETLNQSIRRGAVYDKITDVAIDYFASAECKDSDDENRKVDAKYHKDYIRAIPEDDGSTPYNNNSGPRLRRENPLRVNIYGADKSNGGCSAFGHSCWGGHGKRSLGSPEPDLTRQLGQEETPPHPGYPNSGYILPYGDDMIPIRSGGAFDHDESAREQQLKFKLRNLVKHWMETFRRQQNEDGYIVENNNI